MQILDQTASFTPELHTAGIFLFHKDTVLLVKRAINKPFGDTWGAPGGKQEGQESYLETARREVLEETGINIHAPEINLVKSYAIRSIKDYIYHSFTADVATKPQINLKLDEHSTYGWFKLDESQSLTFMGDRRILDEAFEHRGLK